MRAHAYDAALLTASREMADYFDARSPDGAAGAVSEALRQLDHRAAERAAERSRTWTSRQSQRHRPTSFARLVERIADGTLSGKIAREVFDAMWAGEATAIADAIIAKRGLKQISDSGELEKHRDQVIAANAQQVADYRAGKEKAFNSLVGQVMKATKGKANPQQVNDILKRKLTSVSALSQLCERGAILRRGG